MAERFLKTRELFPMSQSLTYSSFSSNGGGYLLCKENNIEKDNVNNLSVVNEISSMSGGNHNDDNKKVPTIIRKLKEKQRAKSNNTDDIKKRLQKIKIMMK